MALTRPRLSSGVSICTSEKRITTLTASDAPSSASASSDSGKEVDKAKDDGRDAINRDDRKHLVPDVALDRMAGEDDVVSKAPTAGAERSRPRPIGPTLRISRA